MKKSGFLSVPAMDGQYPKSSRDGTFLKGVARIFAVLGIVCFGVSSMAGCGGSNPTAADAVASALTASSTVATLTTANVLGTVVTTETGFSVGSIPVTLLQSTDPTKVIATFTTEAGGGFAFNSLIPGLYIFRIDKTATREETALIFNVVAGLNNVTLTTRSTTIATVPGTGRILGQVLSSTSGAGVSVASIPVILLKDAATVVSRFTTVPGGGFFFNDLADGIYILRIDGSLAYQETAQILEVKAGVTANVTMNLFSISKVTEVSTIDIAGSLTASLDNAPLSVAQVTLDSGQTTVTNALGHFYFQYVASGTRQLTVSKPGLVASYVISFEVRGSQTPIAEKVTYIGQDFTPVTNNEPGAFGTAAFGVKRLVQLGTVVLTYDVHAASIFIGTVTQIKKDATGKLISGATPVGNFEFELWVFDGTSYGPFRTVVTDANGTWKVDNLPHQGDNGYHWLAVASGSYEFLKLNATLDVVGHAVDNRNPPWSNGIAVPGNSMQANLHSPVFTTQAYIAEAGKTTVMDFVLPTFLPYPFIP